MLNVTEADFDDVVLKSDKTVLADFWATWCGPCRMLAPILEDAAKELGENTVVVKVNIDEEPGLAEKYGVMSIPTVIAFKNGKVAGKHIGLTTKEELATLANMA